jgi:hypothetical protein
MMPVIRIPDPVFERLQTIAKPFVDTPATVIERLLDFYDSRTRITTEAQPQGSAPHKDRPFVTVTTDFDPHDPPSLKHTRVIKAEIGGLEAQSWNELVQMAHRQAAAKLKDTNSLRRATRSNIVIGQKETDGFHYISDINASIQNVDADKAWRNAIHLAENLRLNISAEFEWQEKAGAAMPGKRGRVLWDPSKIR